MTLEGGVIHMQRVRPKATTIREIERAVNRLLSSHESSFQHWVKCRIEFVHERNSRAVENPRKKLEEKPLRT
jgi:hypothetical protein